MPIFLPHLRHHGFLESVSVTVCNVGSRKLGQQDDYASQGWAFFAPNLTIYGFDADADACQEANADLERRQVNWIERHIPIALGREVGESTLYVTHHPMCSSLYPPNEPLMQRFENLANLAGLEFTIGLETTTLDTFCREEGIESIDFLQIDVQGADLNVLQGATQILDTVFAIQIEVEFSPIYLDQPLFADIDQFLRARGFTLFDLGLARRVRARSPLKSTRHPGQVLWGEAYYIRDLLQPNNSMPLAHTPENIMKLACIADAMDFPDYTLELLEYLTMHHGETAAYNFTDNIVETLAQFPELVERGLDSLPVVAQLKNHRGRH